MWRPRIRAVAVLLPVYLLLYLTRRRRFEPGEGAHPGTRPPRARGLRTSAVEEADARALTALADCLAAGVPLTDTLALAQQAGPGGRVAWDLYRARPRVQDGKPLSEAWLAVSGTMREELSIGEQTGELDEAARRIAARLRFAVDMRRKKIASVLPVALVLVVGGVVAWRLIGFYTRVYGSLGQG